MTNCDPIAQCIDAVDRPLFKDHLEDITINHSDTDVRDFDVVFVRGFVSSNAALH